jgi:glycosyltransferase involved in cell wall biosynthesis
MTQSPSFAVIIPARNAAATIGRCLDSINALELEPAEIVVVDDASTDETAAIAASKGARVIRQERNVGPGLARNAGAATVNSEFLAFTDSDCEVAPDWLDRFAEAWNDGKYSAVTGPYSGATGATTLRRLIDLTLRYSQLNMPPEIEGTISSNLCLKRRDFEQVGGFAAYRIPFSKMCYFGNEDDELGHLLAVKTGRPVRWLPAAGVYHAYRATVRRYLRQQAKYAEAILVSYARFPAMLTGSSNYSRGGGAMKVVTALLALAALVLAPLSAYALLGLLPFVAANIGCVRYAANAMSEQYKLLTVLECYGFLFLTALAWTKGLAFGAIKGAAGFVYWRIRRE